MEIKKNPELELSKYRWLFFNLGLTISIGLLLVVFEWKTVDEHSTVSLIDDFGYYEEIIDIPLTNQSTPPPPKISQPKIIEIPNEEEIDEAIEIDLDIEITEERSIEELVIEDAPMEEVTEEVFSIVEEMPSFPGGNTEFYKYLTQNLRYPRKALKANVEGKVVVRFIIAEDGGISNVEVFKGIGYDCDEEAVRVLKSSPNWIPGKQRGRNVKVSIMVPLTFEI